MGHIVQNSTKRTTTMDADLTNFRSFFEETGRVDCKTILRDLLVQVESKHGSRYAEPLASSTLINSLDSCLVPGVKVSCENGDFSVSKYGFAVLSTLRGLIDLCLQFDRTRWKP
jgi:hypothetical protein